MTILFGSLYAEEAQYIQYVQVPKKYMGQIIKYLWEEKRGSVMNLYEEYFAPKMCEN